MSAQLSFLHRLRLVAVPTLAQTLGALLLALALLTFAQSSALLARVSITATAIDASQTAFHTRFDAILRSPVASTLALVTFWATLGLIAYLVCWAAYNALIAARNDVTLAATYTNRGHWRGPYETLALKAASAMGLALIFSSLWYGLSFWLALSAGVIARPTFTTTAFAVLAVFGLALQLYLILMFIQLTFSPWYRPQAFTDA
jgi:hypothetical protein